MDASPNAPHQTPQRNGIGSTPSKLGSLKGLIPYPFPFPLSPDLTTAFLGWQTISCLRLIP